MSSTSAHCQSVRYYGDDPNNNHGRPIADPSTVDRSPSDFRAARDAIDAAARRADSGGLGGKEKKTNNNNRNKDQTGRGGYADGPRNGNTQGPDERLSPPPAKTTTAASYKYDSGISTINTDGLKNLQSVYSDEHYNHQQQETEANYAIVDDHIGVVSPLGAVDESSSKRRMKVRQLGNQTIITEHRDPYSFYWQLDELRKVEEPRSRPSPRYDVIVDEESIIEEEEEEEDESDEVDVMQQKPLKFPPPSALPHENPYATPKRDDRPARVERLSHGWERHEDPSGYSYYWHVDSGQVQRDRPTLPPQAPEAEDDTIVEKPPRAPSSLVDASQQTIPLSPPPPPQDPRPMVVEEHAFRQTTTTKKHWADRSATDADEFDERRDGNVAASTRRQRRFLVRSVGWTEFDVTEEHHAALAENAETDPWAHYLREAFCRRHDDDSFRAHASRWAAEDRELILELSEKSSDDSSAVIANLSLLDASTMSLVDAVRCDAVYAWAVDQDDPRYFAYVAPFDDTQQPPTIGETEPFGVDPRRVSTLFRCRVFRCGAFDVAHAIAETLDNICRRRRVAAGAATAAEDECGRPTSLHIITEDGDDGGGWVAASPRDRSTIHYNTPWRLARRSEADGEGGNGGRRIIKESSSLLLTPIDEPKRVIRCQFIGVTQVPKATGIEVLNEAVERLVRDVLLDRRLLVDVAIAPSSIQISEALPPQSQKCAASSWPLVAECRVRYLSFLGIGRDVKHCAFIMHSAPPSITASPSSLAPHSFADNGGWTSPTPADCFHCYVFNVEPTAALMAKTIEAACKLRYQKVLDAHLSGASTPRRTITRRTTTYQ